MSGEVLDEVMIKGNCEGKAEAIVRCQCNIESAPTRCEQAENCMFYSYYKCSKQWQRLAQGTNLDDIQERDKKLLCDDVVAQEFFC